MQKGYSWRRQKGELSREEAVDGSHPWAGLPLDGPKKLNGPILVGPHKQNKKEGEALTAFCVGSGDNILKDR